MQFDRLKVVIFIAGILLINALYAQGLTEQVQLTNCLIAHLPLDFKYKTLSENTTFKIIDVPSENLNELALLAAKGKGGRFINVSRYFLHDISLADKRHTAQQLLLNKTQKTLVARKRLNPFVYKIKHRTTVKAALTKVDVGNVIQTLTHLTGYYNRSATSQNGLKVAEWLKEQFEAMAAKYGRKDTATYFVETGWYSQPSVVTVIGKDLRAPAVVIGAHMDTLDGHMPGADDDGSGAASIMEIANILLAEQLTLKRPIYFIWYAAEERGLIGSQYVVENFVSKSILVSGVLQFDMTGYRKNASDSTMWVYKDNTDPSLSKFVTDLIKTYIKVPVGSSICGYGCSDHASWYEEAIPAAFAFETKFADHNPEIHSSADLIDALSVEHLLNFTKLGVAFAIELATT